ncbi:hypothetical protein [Actinomadura sp. DC4]|uniref:hypothetical protein n=1 Tax=Actinomadura sp. DC4 TaxID=3055069 RepID=UPI0025B1BBF2|nr:hypothetical protein [Actinomadura sp. DC4]MDN3359670.1 hypothetical protein [Actinomadura sp. DC4]
MLTRIELAKTLLRLDEPEEATVLLRPLTPVRPRCDATPLQGQVMLAGARCSTARGDVEAAERAYEAVIGCAGAGSGMDLVHPVAAAARVSLAASRADRGDLDSAAGLLAPVLDNAVLAHGRPAFGAEHPLLRDAVVLADRIGQPHSWGSLPPLPER